jgi:hypothetical protein
VDDDIFHLGIVDRALGPAAPGFFGLGVTIEEAYEVDAFEVREFETLRILNPPAEDQVKLAHVRPLAGKPGGAKDAP